MRPFKEDKKKPPPDAGPCRLMPLHTRSCPMPESRRVIAISTLSFAPYIGGGVYCEVDEWMGGSGMANGKSLRAKGKAKARGQSEARKQRRR
ncbi:hypothetical protein BU24DRAFT_423877 [Aaosphaeria arxii CBS 175.79]|uniref:Uncharacterized protein n=1 Tax=Aaosphaeria arxii CBS 175.79 TaxID=1450172 RepID=A0A6A5XPX8_9PLEO|nr:uncharacterized protein BU24DRAFT_423877 [Aaosphaeria arxii CBS 175.79]KAF2014959.1 hypothetical protein BU24DRAFT_423877 [Aaosphaeria arxii CBS 175.79]